MNFSNVKKLMECLGLGPKNIVGVDIGSSSVKICELSSSKNSYKLSKFAVRSLPEASFFEDEVQKEEEVMEIIRELVEEIAPKSFFASLGVWGSNIVPRRIQIGEGSLEEMRGQVEWELEQQIPFDIDEATTSFHVIGKNDQGTSEVLAVAGKTELLEKFRGLLKNSGLEVKIIDTNQIAIVNVFSHVFDYEMDQEEDSYLIIELGASLTNIIVCRKSILVFSREISWGEI